MPSGSEWCHIYGLLDEYIHMAATQRWHHIKQQAQFVLCAHHIRDIFQTWSDIECIFDSESVLLWKMTIQESNAALFS